MYSKDAVWSIACILASMCFCACMNACMRAYTTTAGERNQMHRVAMINLPRWGDVERLEDFQVPLGRILRLPRLLRLSCLLYLAVVGCHSAERLCVLVRESAKTAVSLTANATSSVNEREHSGNGWQKLAATLTKRWLNANERHDGGRRCHRGEPIETYRSQKTTTTRASRARLLRWKSQGVVVSPLRLDFLTFRGWEWALLRILESGFEFWRFIIT